MAQENINQRLLKEIKDSDTEKKVKNFLKELLIEEISGTVKSIYKEQYKKVIKRNIDSK